jgi:DNA mismatch repair protein MSH2
MNHAVIIIATDTAVVLAVKLSINANERIVGVAFADATERTIDVCQFSDSDRFANLESIVVQRGAKECLLHVDASVLPADRAKLLSLLERCSVPTSERKAAEFKHTDIEQDVKRLVGSIEHNLADLDKKHAMSAVACLIRYLEVCPIPSSSSSFARLLLMVVNDVLPII